MVRASRPLLAVAGAAALLAAMTTSVRAQQSAGARAPEAPVLMLVTEKIDRPDADREQVRYWWRNPSSPEWTPTDRVLKAALGDRPGRVISPSGNTRISRIYQTPDLSLDNASSLASIFGARRVLVGQVRYEFSPVEHLFGLRAVYAEASFQLVDVASADPEVLRTIDVRRSTFGAKSFERLAERARNSVGGRAGDLLGRILQAASGPIGIETDEPTFRFHSLQRGPALENIREFAGELDGVEGLHVRWASEGVIALEVDAASGDDAGVAERVAKALEEHDFEEMRVTRRRAGRGDAPYEFDVEVTGDFGKARPERENSRGTE